MYVNGITNGGDAFGRFIGKISMSKASSKAHEPQLPDGLSESPGAEIVLEIRFGFNSAASTLECSATIERTFSKIAPVTMTDE